MSESAGHDVTAGRQPWPAVVFDTFLGQAPDWYKVAIVVFLIINPLALFAFGPFVAGWLLLVEFIFTLAMALKCYPLQPGGLLAIEAAVIGLVSTETVYYEITANLPVILLLMFMVAGIYFLRDLLLHWLTYILVNVKSRIALSLLFCFSSAVLSAFLDALTVVAVIITVATGLYAVYHRVESFQGDEVARGLDDGLDMGRPDLEQFRAFLRGLMMHAAVGTALGGVCTMVGEPQNLLIANLAGWNFLEFIVRMLPVSMPVLAMGLITCFVVEKMHWFGYGSDMPPVARQAIKLHFDAQVEQRTQRQTVQLWMQGFAALFLLVGLALHLAEVGLIGLTVIVLATAFCGVIDEKRIGHAFEEALPFTALLVAFFAIIGVIHEQHLFQPVVDFVLHQEAGLQVPVMYLASGLLSAISDNVFVATVYISEVKSAFDAGALSREQFELLAVAVNTGTNIPSVATPNGQAAFLFILTSALAPLIRLGYVQMLWMAMPYAITMTTTGLLAVIYLL